VNARAAVCLFALTFVAIVARAEAHVTAAPAELRAGSYDEITFRCPDERANSATTKLVVQMPQDHRIASVKLRPVPGWHGTVTMRNGAVDTITWEGGTIAPDEYQDFSILAGPMPAVATELVFKAVQTYANGEIVRWIELRRAGEPEPAFPAPVVRIR
jgi:periplasmic copper chaperone A